MNFKTFFTEWWERIRKWAVGWLYGGPHFVVGDPADPYLKRWYVIPRNDWLCIYLHKFLRDDDDRALHDHPWWSLSFLVWGEYIEQTPFRVCDNGACTHLGEVPPDGFCPYCGRQSTGRRHYIAPAVIPRRATCTHRIELVGRNPAWTLFITGPRVREWGFHCPGGRWVHWKDFTKADKPGEIGRGCGGG